VEKQYILNDTSKGCMVSLIGGLITLGFLVFSAKYLVDMEYMIYLVTFILGFATYTISRRIDVKSKESNKWEL